MSGAVSRSFSRELTFYADLLKEPGTVDVERYKQAAVRAIGSLSNNGWSAGSVRVKPTEMEGCYKLSLTLQKNGQKRFDVHAAQAKSEELAERMLRRLSGWRTTPQLMVQSEDGVSSIYDVRDILKFPPDIMEHFSHIYDRDVQIKSILRSIEIARDTNMEVRNHGLLYGYSGGGKTLIGLALEAAFGKIAFRRLDATATTKAGAERLLLEGDIVPPVIWLEEAEKIAEGNLSWLLGVLDSRGEITKTTARTDVSRLARCLVFVTVNDIEKFKTFHHNALADRFNLPLYCPIPNESLLRQILHDEVKLLPDGNPDWVEPALRYGKDVENTYQARRLKAILAIGGDRLLDGSFQREQEELLNRKNEDASEITKYQLQ